MSAPPKKPERRGDKPVRDYCESGDSLHAYIREIARFEPLVADEEKALGRKIQTGDQEALNRLVEANLRFVVSYGKRYRGLGLSFLDVIHEGNLGLIEAAKRFDPDRNVRFISYAVWWIRQAILHALSEQIRLLRVPKKLGLLLAKVQGARQRLTVELDRQPTNQEVSERTAIAEDDIAALQWTPNEAISLSTAVGDDGRLELGDTLEQVSIPGAELELIQASLVDQIHAMVAGLEDKEREVITRRFGLDGEEPRTLQEIGETMGVSRERVRQLESRAKDKMRRMRQAQGLKGYLN